MANKSIYILPEYTSDFGGTYKDIRFSVDSQDKVDLNLEQPTDNTQSRCGGSRSLFIMRKGILIFSDNTSIEVPIASLDQVPAFMAQYGGNAEIACIALKGEKWRAIPPAVLGGNYATTGIEGANKPKRVSFLYKYNLDGDANNQIISKTSIEQAPDVIYTAQQACLDKEEQSSLACTFGAGAIEPRKFKGIRANTATNGTIARQIIVSNNDPTEIKQCGATVMVNFNCLGYEGQSMANALDFYSSGEGAITV